MKKGVDESLISLTETPKTFFGCANHIHPHLLVILAPGYPPNPRFQILHMAPFADMANGAVFRYSVTC